MGENIPEGVTTWVDLGFQGIEGDYPSLKVSIPRKKPRGKELREEDKKLNTWTASLRVLVEHAIGGVKRLGSLSQVYRNYTPKFEDKLMNVGCGLWNFHLAS